jgi:hypothetical protein
VMTAYRYVGSSSAVPAILLGDTRRSRSAERDWERVAPRAVADKDGSGRGGRSIVMPERQTIS